MCQHGKEGLCGVVVPCLQLWQPFVPQLSEVSQRKGLLNSFKLMTRLKSLFFISKPVVFSIRVQVLPLLQSWGCECLSHSQALADTCWLPTSTKLGVQGESWVGKVG